MTSEQKRFVSPQDVQDEIDSVYYVTGDNAIVSCFANMDIDLPRSEGFQYITLCFVKLKNGTKVVGINYGAIDPARHSYEIGREQARANAEEQIYQLLGFRLRDQLTELNNKIRNELTQIRLRDELKENSKPGDKDYQPVTSKYED